MRRRDFIKAMGGLLAAWPRIGRAQQPDEIRRVGVIIGVADDPQGRARYEAFRDGMRSFGWIEGRNVHFEVRFAEGTAELGRKYATEIISLAPDLVVANGAAVISALQQLTKTIPIVFAQTVDPVSSGFVESLARPGGNTTGFTSLDYGIGTKWLETLREIAPKVTRVGVLRDPTVPGGAGQLGAIQGAAAVFGASVVALDARGADVIDRTISSFAREPNGGMIVLANPLTTVHRELIVRLAARTKLPTVYPYRFYVASGGLISYGIDNADLWRRSASYVDRILKGEKPSDLPVQEPTKYELVINLKTAKSLGLIVPPALLARADEIIE